MTDKELNLRAGLAAFSDADRVVPVNLDQFDPLNSRDDLIKLLVETGISFSRPREGDHCCRGWRRQRRGDDQAMRCRDRRCARGV